MKTYILFFFLMILVVNIYSQSLVQFAEGTPPLIGFKDKTTKKVLIKPKYTYALDFVDGISGVSESPLTNLNMAGDTKWKIIDANGKYISPDTIEFDKVEIKKNGLAIVYILQDRNNGDVIRYTPNYKVGVLKKDGTFLLPCEYDKITEMREDYLMVFSSEKGVGVIEKGVLIISPQKEFYISEYIGCGLFQYINPNGKKTAMNDPLTGGVVDRKLKVWINQDSVNFVPSIIINSSNCANKTSLLGFTQPHRAGSSGVYRIGFGLIIPVDKYSFSKNAKDNQPNKLKILNNIITITDESFDNRYSSDKTIAKYDFNGKIIYTKK